MPDESFKSGKPPANVANPAKDVAAALDDEQLELAALTAIEIERRHTFRREALEAAGDPEKLEAIGAKEVRRGTGVRVVRRREPNPNPNPDVIKALMGFFASISADFAMGPQSLDELVAWLREEADEVYKMYGLPTGAAHYWHERAAAKTDWSRWHGGSAGDGDDWGLMKVPAGSLANYENCGDDHPVSHAGRLHTCALMLEAAAKRMPVDVLQVAIRAMAAQSAADTLYAVTAKRRASGLTDAEAVFRGDDNRVKTGSGGKAASKAKTEEGDGNRRKVLELAKPMRENNPAKTDDWLIDQIKVAIDSRYPVKLRLKRSTIHTHVRALKKSGDLQPRVKP